MLAIFLRGHKAKRYRLSSFSEVGAGNPEECALSPERAHALGSTTFVFRLLRNRSNRSPHG